MLTAHTLKVSNYSEFTLIDGRAASMPATDVIEKGVESLILAALTGRATRATANGFVKNSALKPFE
jgi:hypothetical protein